MINPDYILFIVKYSCFLLQHKFPTEQLLVCVCVCVCILVLNLYIITVINVTYKLCGLVGLFLDCLFSDAVWLNYRRYVKVATNPALLPVRDARWRAVEPSFQKNHLTGKKINSMGQTNPTRQRELLEKRASKIPYKQCF